MTTHAVALGLAVASLSLLAGLASADSHSKPLVISQTFYPGGTDPTSGSTGWALTSFGVAEKLFTVNREGCVVGQLATKVKRLDKFSWEVHLKPDYKFSNGDAVTAQAVADALTEQNEKNDGAKASLGNMTVTALDNMRVKIQSERATPVMDAKLAEWAFVIYLQRNDKKFFTGPYAIKSFTEEQLDLIPNSHYPRASERSEIIVKKSEGGTEMASALAAKQLDMAFNLPVESLPRLREDGLTVKSFSVGYQYMMWYNTKKLSDVKVRKAMDMAIDRTKLTQAVRAGTATRSLFPANTPHNAQDTGLHADKSGAERLLEEAGWVKASSGIREKDGVPLTVRLVAYPQRPDLVTMQPEIAKDLEALGVKVTQTVTSAGSWDELDAIMAKKDYDILLWAQHTLPAGDPQHFMNMFFRSDAGSNHAQLESSQVDAMIDALSHAEAGDRVPASAAAHKAILEEVPVSFLMTPSWHVGLGSRLSKYEPWGSDYYMIRADFGLPDADAPANKPSACPVNTVGTPTKAASPPSPVATNPQLQETTSSAGRVGMAFSVGGIAMALAMWL